MSRFIPFSLFVLLSFIAACASEDSSEADTHDAASGGGYADATQQEGSDSGANPGSGVGEDALSAWRGMMGNDAGGSEAPPAVDAGIQEEANDPREQEAMPFEGENETAPEESKGACDNDADRATLLELENINGLIQGCALNCVGEEACSKNCVVEDMGVSEGCGACFAGTISCTMKNCLLKCMDSERSGCLTCQEANCFGPFEVCAGLEPPSP